MKLKPFDLEAALQGAPVVTRSGMVVTDIFHFKTAHLEKEYGYSVIAVIAGSIEHFTTQGKYFVEQTDQDDDLDLFIKPVQVTKWVNVYCVNGGYRTGVNTFNSEQQAKELVDDLTRPDYIGTFPITIEV